ncbi:thiamine ABC transporter ATP-binding protein [Aureimonas populi]|uniref:Thiamine ABC transporter ATP-binding protein n=1 Tax=Aureimonas populi TaxID=1701758 RepID=A0ABW5CJ65_9HYPH|nr:thiamine ABC transporter ATP-binding protein [Aureimonas populi]
MTPALTLDAVTYSFEGMRLSFDLCVAPGEWLALIGPSGAGKSTLLDLAAGFLAPASGRILMEGRDVTETPPGERPVSLVFQENNLFAHLTAQKNVALGLSSRLFTRKADMAAARDALAAVGLAGLEARRPFEMSGGERQRVALARAFLRRRPLLLLDEPFAALGPALRVEMLQLLAQLRRSFPVTVVMVTHHPQDAAGFADRVAFVEAGRIVLTGPTSQVLGPDADPRVSAYLGERG